MLGTDFLLSPMKTNAKPVFGSAKKCLFLGEKEEKEKIPQPSLSTESVSLPPPKKKLKINEETDTEKSKEKKENSALKSIEMVVGEEAVKASLEVQTIPILILLAQEAARTSAKMGTFLRLLPNKPEMLQQTPPLKSGISIDEKVTPETKTQLLYQINERKLTIVESKKGKFYSPGGHEYIFNASAGMVNLFLREVDTVKYMAPAKKTKSKKSTSSWQAKGSDTVGFFSQNLKPRDIPIPETVTTVAAPTTTFILKPFESPIELTKSKLKKVKKDSHRSQIELFGKTSPNDAAKECGLNPAVAYEYLHIYAHRFLGNKSQTKENLVLGTAIVNAQMITVENLLVKIAKAGHHVTINAHAVIDKSKAVYEKFHYALKIKYEITINKTKKVVLYFFPDSDIPITLDIANLIICCLAATLMHPADGLHCLSPSRENVSSLLATPTKVDTKPSVETLTIPKTPPNGSDISLSETSILDVIPAASAMSP